MNDRIAAEASHRFLNWTCATGVFGLAAGGFTLSFSSLQDLAASSGIDPDLAFLWPLVVDGFIVVATFAALALRSGGRAAVWYPWTALVLFSAISVAGNAIHALEASDLKVPILVATVVSSVPALALLIASHLLVVMIDGHRREIAKTVRPSEVAAVQGQVVKHPAEAALNMPLAAASLRASEVSDPDAVLARLREHHAAGRQITGAVLAGELGVSERTGRRRLDRFKATFPELFELEGAQ